MASARAAAKLRPSPCGDRLTLEPARQISPLLNGDHLIFLSNIVSRCDADHSVNRGGPTQWVSGWVCAGPNRSPLAWERSVERLTLLYRQLWLRLPVQSQFERGRQR